MNGRRLAKLAYKAAIRHTPYALKYSAMTAWQRTLPPYHLVKTADVVVQIGVAGQLCPYGRSQAIFYSRLVGNTGKVFAFEAIPENLELFHTYIARHGITNIETEATGLWNEKGILSFDAPAEGHGSARIKTVGLDRPFRYSTEREFPVDTLDNLLAQQDIQRLDLINITTNGAEAKIIEGGMSFLSRFRPALCMPALAENLEFFESKLSPLGYTPQTSYVRLSALGSPFKILWADSPLRAEIAVGDVNHTHA